MTKKTGSLAFYGKPGWRKDGNFYSHEDDLKIINGVLDLVCNFTIGGNALWVHMEDSGILPDRSWQSLKERFRKIIYPRIREYEISDSDKEKIKRGMKKVKKRKTGLRFSSISTRNRMTVDMFTRNRQGRRKQELLIEISSDDDTSETHMKPKKQKLYCENSFLGPVSPINVSHVSSNVQLRECTVQLQRLNYLGIGSYVSNSTSCSSDSKDCHQHENGGHGMNSKTNIANTIPEENNCDIPADISDSFNTREALSASEDRESLAEDVPSQRDDSVDFGFINDYKSYEECCLQ